MIKKVYFDHLLKCINKVFDITAASETRITKQTPLTTNINLKNYAIEFTPTESSAGGTLFYIASHLSYKPRPDLYIYKANQLESTFVEIINSQESNIVIGCVYKHPNMDILHFKNNYLNPGRNKSYFIQVRYSTWSFKITYVKF